MALCREGALVRTGQAHGRGASGCGFRCCKRPGRESTVPPSSLERTFARVSCEHPSSLRECFASFSARLCAMSHISDPKRIFFPPKSRCGNFFQPFPFGHPRYIRSL